MTATDVPVASTSASPLTESTVTGTALGQGKGAFGVGDVFKPDELGPVPAYYVGLLMAVIGWDFVEIPEEGGPVVAVDIMVANEAANTGRFFLGPDLLELITEAGDRYEVGYVHGQRPGEQCLTTFLGSGEVVVCRAYFRPSKEIAGSSKVYHVPGANEDAVVDLGPKPTRVAPPFQGKADTRIPALGERTESETGLAISLHSVSSSIETDEFDVFGRGEYRVVEVAFTLENRGGRPLRFTDMFNAYPIRVKDPSTHRQNVNYIQCAEGSGMTAAW
jgi:hypothetical protein